jgi:hypothetical protein
MKETIVKIAKRIVRFFDGRKACHAKLDAAIQRNEDVRAKAESFVTMEIERETRKPVGNGASH